MLKVFIAVLLVLCAHIGMADVVVNEFLASNNNSFQDPDEPNDYPDWIELFNTGDASVNLGGLFLTDNLSRPAKWQIPPDTHIPAHGFILFMADGDVEQGVSHTSFKLDSKGGFLALVNRDGSTVVDSLTYGKQYSDVH